MTEPTVLTEALAVGADAVRAGDFKRAADAFRRAHEAAPGRADIINNLAAALARSEGLVAALPWLQKAADLDPGNMAVRVSIGVTLAHLGRIDEAEPYLDAALAHEPENARALEGMGIVANSRGEDAAAASYFDRALARDPRRAEALFRRGLAALESGDAEGALELLERARALAPFDIRYLTKGAIALAILGRYDEGHRRHDEVLAQRPNDLGAWASKLFAATFDPGLTPFELGQVHKRFDSIFPASLRRTPRPRPTEGRRLRVGYVASDYRYHVGASQLLALIRAHDRSQFEVFCYTTVAGSDDMTERFKALAEHWRPLHDCDDDRAADVVEADGIDVLVDFDGHGIGTRLGIFARRPAPVQVSLPGYVATTGLSAIHYRITDAVSDPTEADQLNYAEQLVHLPEGHFCFEPMIPLPPVADRPAGEGVVFGSFHNRLKYGPPVIETWAAVMRRVPNSRLLLKDGPFGHAPACNDMRHRFAAFGIDPARLLFLGRTPLLQAHYRCYDQVDVALDPFPFNGTTTSLDALLMGVPVVALRGDRHVARLAANILTRVGLTDLIAETREAYVEIAAALAADAPRRRALRGELRGMVEASPVMRAERVVRPLEDFYRRAVAAAAKQGS